MKQRISFLILLAGSVSLAAMPALAQQGRGQGAGPPRASGAPGLQRVPAARGPGQAGAERTPDQARGPQTRGDRARTEAPKNGAAVRGREMKGADLLAENTHLSSNLQRHLPEGTDLQEASAGFKNLGQFVAAVHVSKNLGVPFDELKGQVLGPADGSLGRAIHDLQPDLSPGTAKAEAKRAERQAKEEIKAVREEAKLAQRQAKAQNRRPAEPQGSSEQPE